MGKKDDEVVRINEEEEEEKEEKEEGRGGEGGGGGEREGCMRQQIRFCCDYFIRDSFSPSLLALPFFSVSRS
jgi:hypothetical protein